MQWHERFKRMKADLGYTNASIAEITGNTPDSIKSSTQPNVDIPRWLKLAIVIHELKSDMNATAEMLRKQKKENVYSYIRRRLAFKEDIISQLRYSEKSFFRKEHRRFEMSGYESKKGECTLFNMSIVNEFADLGIYDYTDYLFLDFYKGHGTLYIKYFQSKDHHEIDLAGYGTVKIIYEIFERTIFADKLSKRRV